MDISEVARTLAKQQRRQSQPCAVCGKAVPMRARQKYCSNACKVRAYQQRKREWENGPDQEDYDIPLNASEIEQLKKGE